MENQQFQRQIAYKVPINQILRNQYIEQEGWNPNYIQINNKQVSRVNLIATVIDKQVSSSLATLVLDDSTGIIQARSFNEDIKKVTGINVGDTVLIIGRPRKFNDQIFITIEISRKIDVLWSKVRKIELQKEFSLLDKQSAEIKSQPNHNIENEKILELIKENDDGNGVDIDQIILSSGLDESEAHEVISELIKQGEIYEPKPNKIKILG